MFGLGRMDRRRENLKEFVVGGHVGKKCWNLENDCDGVEFVAAEAAFDGRSLMKSGVRRSKSEIRLLFETEEELLVLLGVRRLVGGDEQWESSGRLDWDEPVGGNDLLLLQTLNAFKIIQRNRIAGVQTYKRDGSIDKHVPSFKPSTPPLSSSTYKRNSRAL